MTPMNRLKIKMAKPLFLCVLGLLIGGITSCSSTRNASGSVYSRPTRTPKPKPSPQAPSREQSQVLEATSRVKVTTEMVLAYIDQYKGIAQDNMRQFGIPSSIILAQGILESGAGTGTLCVQANNHFGIKCHKEWTGPSVRHDDDAAQECFRKYDDPEQSFRDHADFLRSRKRYASLFDLEIMDYVAWANGLKQAGYATDPGYPSKLAGLIERYQLHRYDTEVTGKPTAPSPLAPAAAPTNSVNTSARTHTVVKGDTLYNISKRYNVPIDQLMAKNNLPDNNISLGQILIVE